MAVQRAPAREQRQGDIELPDVGDVILQDTESGVTREFTIDAPRPYALGLRGVARSETAKRAARAQRRRAPPTRRP